jgi:hypothetical protein
MSNEILLSPVRFGVCADCASADKIVYSGVDALLLGVTVGFICYPCANGGHEYWQDAE